MHITLQHIGKRFNREWIFRKLSYQFQSGQQYAITGSNGSGKSTLLQVMAGALTFTEGEVIFTTDEGQLIDPALHFKQVAIAAPYLDLIEEMSAAEFLQFHQQFKPLTQPISAVLETVQLTAAANKQIRYFSSGMKQRLKLAQAFFAATPILLLDEPTTNLDATGIALYQQLLQEQTQQKTVIISSNDPQEYAGSTGVISILDYK